ncbi:MAG: hypothetical protein LBS60_06890 [Deltaproteobacteria bacterium]|jgi:hypothetical protein|nr:hypothetical protein [Deltaproteobacteria bacterium]
MSRQSQLKSYIKPILKVLSFLLALITVLALGPKPLKAADIRDYFIKVPESFVYNLSAVDRRALLDSSARRKPDYVAPSPAGFWVEIHGPQALTLFGHHRTPLVFKTFPSKERWKLLVICQSRQTSGPTEGDPASPAPSYDLNLLLVDHNDELNSASLDTYIPPISVLDFVTGDTLTDRGAVRDLAMINQGFDRCLTCHASVLDPSSLDILTVTTINGHSCLGYLPQYKLLPLYWNGEYFIKPHDRAAPPEDKRTEKPSAPHGPYYRPPTE